MSDSAISTFDLGELAAGTGVEVVLVTPASVRLVSDGAGATSLTSPDRVPVEAVLRPKRHLTVPRTGRWRLLVEHAAMRKGGCAIRLRGPAPVSPNSISDVSPA